MKSYYKPGCWNAICDVCGFLFKSDQLQKRWDGFMVCSKDWEARHPQEFLRVPSESKSPAWKRPDWNEAVDSQDILTINCTLENSVAIADVAVAGCSVTGRTDKWGDWSNG